MKSLQSAWGVYSLQIPQPLKVHLHESQPPFVELPLTCLSHEIMRPQPAGTSNTSWLSRTPHGQRDCVRSIPPSPNGTWLRSQRAKELGLFLTFECLFYQRPLSNSSLCVLFHVLEHSPSCMFYPLESNVCCFLSKHRGFFFTNSKWQDMDCLSSPGWALSTWRRWPVGIIHSAAVNYRSCSGDIDKNSD